MEPEFIVDEEPLEKKLTLREGVIGFMQREHELRQRLSEKNLSYEQELLQEAKFLRGLIATMEIRCEELIRAEQSRMAEADGIEPQVREEKGKWLRRVERIQQTFDNELEKFGVTRYIPSGKALPNSAKIRDTIPGTGQEPGTIIEVIKPGYLWRGEVLRAAEVLTAE
ncbi:MAG: nucleotide exchange factor GrpE [Blastocatellia bacterium]|nr:nucleotide exchange factor GrpE [Blastocatellia bacterium]